MFIGSFLPVQISQFDFSSGVFINTLWSYQKLRKKFNKNLLNRHRFMKTKKLFYFCVALVTRIFFTHYWGTKFGLGFNLDENLKPQFKMVSSLNYITNLFLKNFLQKWTCWFSDKKMVSKLNSVQLNVFQLLLPQ
jgi:hypothetical protein